MDTDVYFHKLLTFRGWKRELKFQTSQALFSAHDIDTGTKFLLRTIVEAGYPAPRSILDLGCGYGPLGLVLKALYPQSAVHLTDRDALAVTYARRNAALNNMSVESYASLGYDDLTRHDYDLIVSNIPGKAGEPVIAYLLREAQYHLKPGGMAAVVIVGALEALAEKILAETADIEVVLKRARAEHTVFHYRFSGVKQVPDLTALEHGIYCRKDLTISYGGLSYPVETAYGLPEFDSLSYDTEMLLKTLQGFKNKPINQALVFNPGQGHIPVALNCYFHPGGIALADRDLLALRYSRLNLVKNGFSPNAVRLFHTAGLEVDEAGKYNLVAGILPEENKEAIQLAFDRAVNLLDTGGFLALAGGSTAITRLETYAGTQAHLDILSRERRRGFSALLLEKLDTARKKG